MESQAQSRRWAVWSPIFIRLAMGIVFVVAGAGKFGIGPKSTGSIAGFAGFLAQLGVPAPELFAWVVGLVELVGGILLLVGLFTRYVAVLIAVDMAVATLLVHLPNGFAVVNNGPTGYEYTLTLTLIAISLVFSGPGALSLEHALFGRELLPKRQNDRIDQQVKA
ncbi:putative oxidoreductase [Haladaptatus litoreus]|uniref:Putative oxidoreductase n=1 Tax=Haladaptatus litoreus TaxID=553468 RepID=A0A1N7DAF7_9EURY|nr:DoxX family protein [Haladaptatus litoreus]SIR72715.1 putative oxidoreductase [Haladaptatus litoreus]